MSRRFSVTNGILYALLACGAVLVLFPVYVTFLAAFKSFKMMATDFFGFPTALYLDNFRMVFQDAKILSFVRNSVFITVVSVFFIIILVPAVSYAISRRFRGIYYRILYYVLVGGIFVPALVILVPLVKITAWWGLQNPAGIIPIYVGIAFSSNTFIAVGYMKSIPIEIDESAAIDGAGVFTIFIRMIYPMLKPMIATIAILAVLWVWNDFQMPLVLLNQKQDYWTLPLFQFNFRNQYTINYNGTAAALTISMIPMIIVYLAMQRYIISGITAGAIKG
jgi:raffinose/stachyose/melibiose transport system permease protein